MTKPEWLERRKGADLEAGPNGRVRLLTIGGKPQYRLTAVPAQGKFTCAVTQTVNGKRVDGGKTYETADAALSGGLEELRERLGW